MGDENSIAIVAVADPMIHAPIEAALCALPASLLQRSGSIFYTGRAAFCAQSDIYILGLNPGGDPIAQANETICVSRQKFFEGPAYWSAYADESWRGAPPGTWGMQPRVLHMLNSLGFDPQAAPAGNVVFVRTPTEAALKAEMADLLRICWPVHQAVIDALDVRVLLCFGATAGRWVRNALNAHQKIDFYREENDRRWASEAHAARDGRVVVTLTHPGRADWCNVQSDPTPMIRRALAGIQR